jgi:hypothetical protein
MHTDMTPQNAATRHDTSTTRATDQTLEHERAVDAILDDCFLALGQAIGLRASLDFEAVLFVRDHFRPRFLAAMQHFGNRWLDDRTTVTAVIAMLGERAVRHADGAASIDLATIRRASAEVQRYCQLHASRRTRGQGNAATDAATALIAGYWCTWDPEP